jgi:hypothetical protein
VKNVGTAKTMLGGFDKPLGNEYFTTMIGSPTQHQSNQMVFDKLYNQFKAQAKKGNLDPELLEKINGRLASAVDKDGNPVFPSDVDILSKDFKKIANTFDRRAIAGNLMGGVGVGGKKGQIIDYEKIIRETTDPYLLDAPSGSLGYRLWTPSGEIIERPDLHPAFPAIATGEDLGVEFKPAAQDILMEPWVKNIRETKGREPGYMDWTRGRPPSVQITEDILRNLEESGNKQGGLIKVKRKAKGGVARLDGDDQSSSSDEPVVDEWDEYWKSLEPSYARQAYDAVKNFAQKTAAPALQTGLDAVLPARKAGNILIDQGVVKPIKKMAGNPYANMETAFENQKDLSDLHQARVNAIREAIGLEPAYADKNMLSGAEITPYPETYKYPKHGKPVKKASGGEITADDLILTERPL